MARLWEMQQDLPIEAFALTFAHKGGRADVLAALAGDQPPLAPLAREIDEAPADARARKMFLARRALLRRAVARRLRCAVEAVEIGRADDGGPRLLAPDSGLHLSVSGRGDLIAVAVCDTPVGVDIEPVGEAFDAPLNVLHPAERAALAAAGAGAHEHFLRLWTVKEAYLKALRTGLAREPVEIEIRLGPPVRIDGAELAHDCADAVIFDRDAPVALAAAFAQRLLYRGRPLVLACVALAAD